MDERQRFSSTERLPPTTSGKPLEPHVRSALEPRFQHDFSKVRVHADAEADRLARGYDAAAFAVGQDVYFRDNMYNPYSEQGMHILAHELTHTVQQKDAKPHSRHTLERDDQNSASEIEARTVAQNAVAGHNVNVQTSSPAQVQCLAPDFLENILFRGAGTIVKDAPLIGTVVNGTQSIYHSASAGLNLLDGDGRAAREHATDAAISAAKAIPILGTGLGAFELTYDMLANDEQQAGGAQPTVHDIVDSWLFDDIMKKEDMPAQTSTEPVDNEAIDEWMAEQARARAEQERANAAAAEERELEEMSQNVPMEP
jgi:Domain of unknown function (DUF4157)